jgi:DNA-binding transcriptional MocR family regulator
MITVAYEQLAAEGFIEVRQGARPRVPSSLIAHEASHPPAKCAGPVHLSAYGERLRATPPRPDYLPKRLKVDFRYGDLAPSDFPTLVWKRAMNEAMAQRPARLASSAARSRASPCRIFGKGNLSLHEGHGVPSQKDAIFGQLAVEPPTTC